MFNFYEGEQEEEEGRREDIQIHALM